MYVTILNVKHLSKKSPLLQILLLALITSCPCALGTDEATEKNSTVSAKTDATPVMDKSIVVEQLGKANVILKADSLRVNDEKSFFSALNLDTPGMENVKKAVSADDWPAAKKALLEYMRSRKPPKFSMDRWEKDEFVAFVKNEMSESIPQAIADADRVYRHEFDWGCPYTFKGPIVWDKEKTGVTFSFGAMLSRMLFLNNLGVAWWLSNDKKYPQCAVEIVNNFISSCPMPPTARRHWMEITPPTNMCITGNPWGELLEVAERMGSWLAFNDYFIDSDEITPEFYYRFLCSLLEHARFTYVIELYGGYTGGNWQLVETSNLARVGIMFPEFKEARDWRNVAINILTQKSEKEVLPDGAYCEKCISYHNWCLLKFLEVLSIAQNNGVELPQNFVNTIEKMRRYVQMLSYPGSTRTPSFGDAAYVKWWAESTNDDNKKNNTIKSLCEVGLNSYKEQKEHLAKVPGYTSSELPYAGFYIMRTGWTPKDKFLFFDCAPSQRLWSHWHNSAFNVDIYAYGRPLIVDSGMRSYDEPGYEDYFRRGIGHNIIEIANVETFPAPKLKYWLRSPEFCVLEAQADIAIHDIHKIHMTRRVLFVTNDYWIVDDIISHGAEHRQRCSLPVRAYWHLNSRSVVAGGNQVQLSIPGQGKGARSYYVDSVNNQDISFYTNDKNIGNILIIPDKQEDYKSLAIMADTPCGGHVACYRQDFFPRKNLTAYFTSLLYPFEGDKRPDVSFKDGVVKIGEDRVDSYLRNGEQTDGDCAILSRQNGQLKHLLLVRGSFIKNVVNIDKRVEYLIINRIDEATLDIKLIGDEAINILKLSGFSGIKQVSINGHTSSLTYDKNTLIVNGPFQKISSDPNDTKLFWIMK